MRRSSKQQDDSTMRGRVGKLKVTRIDDEGNIYANGGLAQSIEQGRDVVYNPELDIWDVSNKNRSRLYISSLPEKK